MEYLLKTFLSFESGDEGEDFWCFDGVFSGFPPLNPTSNDLVPGFNRIQLDLLHSMWWNILWNIF